MSIKLAVIYFQSWLLFYRYLKLEKEVGMNFKPSLVTDDWQLHVWKTVAKWFLQRIEFFAFSDIESRPRVLVSFTVLVVVFDAFL